ncbi:RadC family protein [Chengkuizengella marina]|uniref:JAB domain-containing protein n=1 Tax=Chengkuizengella marina TaxID=2507566 RepID=A0A6N9Q4T4_9BACL|nr:DNA repair protein RadC [Chengkuizengella marina]NBI29780.1 JAB domain-containing protein [Chengkuizengella marina]
MSHLSQILSDVPENDRPRERMLQYGAHVLTDSEIIAILLRTGSYDESAITLAQKLLKKLGGLRQLVDASTEQFIEMKGIGPAKALQIQAGIELGRRLAKSKLEHYITIKSPGDAAKYIMEDLRYLKKEHFICLFLNTKNQLIAQETLSMGSLNASIVHPREVFRAAIKRSSASIICVHNHPSGDPTPSPEDIEITNRLLEAGQVIGIEVLDHLIIGDQSFISLKERGLM